MAVSNVTRTLRDGSIVIKDGDSPVNTCTVLCDAGDLRWTETDEWRVVRCRGQLDHVRPGDAQECELNCTIRWMNLLGHTYLSADPIQPYEIINNLESTYTSVEAGHYALKWEFTCTDPSAVASEKVVFAVVRKTSLECAEGDEFNTLSFSGMDNETRPTVSRL